MQTLKQQIFTSAPRERWIKILLSYVPRDKALPEVREMTAYILKIEREDKISLPSDLKYTAALYKFLERVIYKIAKIPNTVIDEATLEFVAKEIMTNALRHGYRYQKGGVVDVEYELVGRELIIRITDYGYGISQGATSKGHGIPMLRKVFDAVYLRPAPDRPHKGIKLGKGAQLTLIKFIS